ncbi:MAG: TolC family protein [Bacteroidales bacterium]|nr:TolC family protein [Bacteroidales bacterium]MCF8327467.1 TolC family protein [Bacteroidales bacterium]
MKRLIIIMLMIISASVNAQQANLEELQKVAVKDNPGIKAAFNQWYSGLEKATTEAALPDPSMAFGYFVSPVETRLGPQEFRAGVSQQIPWFGTLKFRSKAAESEARADYYLIEQKSNKILKQLTVAYYEAYLAAKLKQIHQSQLKWLEAQQEWIETKYKDGSKSMADVVRIKMAIDRQKEQIEKYKDDITKRSVRVNKIANREPYADIHFPDSIDAATIAEFPGMDKVQLDSVNPGLMVLQNKEQASRYAGIASERSNYPALNLGAEYIAIGERTDMEVSGSGKDAAVAKISLNLPVNIRKNKARVAMKEFQAEKYNHLYEEKKNELYAQIFDLSTEYQDAFRKLELAAQQAEDALYVEELLKSDYATGAAGFDEWMEIRRELLEYQKEQIRNLVNALKINAERKMILNQFKIKPAREKKLDKK